jgi:hypothetical protein
MARRFRRGSHFPQSRVLGTHPISNDRRRSQLRFSKPGASTDSNGDGNTSMRIRNGFVHWRVQPAKPCEAGAAELLRCPRRGPRYFRAMPLTFSLRSKAQVFHREATREGLGVRPQIQAPFPPSCAVAHSGRLAQKASRPRRKERAGR